MKNNIYIYIYMYILNKITKWILERKNGFACILTSSFLFSRIMKIFSVNFLVDKDVRLHTTKRVSLIEIRAIRRHVGFLVTNLMDYPQEDNKYYSIWMLRGIKIDYFEEKIIKHIYIYIKFKVARFFSYKFWKIEN